MIKPIQNSISFQANGMKDFQAKTAKKTGEIDVKATVPDYVAPLEVKEKPKFSLKEGIASVLKGYNKVTNTTSGVIRGIADGVVLVGVTGFVGRNLKKSEGHIGKTIAGMFSDTGKIIKEVFKSRPISSLITKSPLENIKSLKNIPSTFYNKCLKGNKATAAVAAMLFAGAVTVRTIQGKMLGNKASSEVDHNFGLKH